MQKGTEMKKEKQPVTNMVELLELMSRSEAWSRKVRASLHRIRSTPPETYVEEIFDDGHGHSNAVTKKRTPITEELFQRAVRECFVGGVYSSPGMSLRRSSSCLSGAAMCT